MSERLLQWHGFVYRVLYPAILGAILYELLRIDLGWAPQQFMKLSVGVLYCIDYFHLQQIGAEANPTWHDTVFDGLIAIAVGIAYWQVAGGALTLGYVLLTMVVAGFAGYNIYRKLARRVVALFALAGCFAIAACLSRAGTGSWTAVALASWAGTVWYGLYVAVLMNLPGWGPREAVKGTGPAGPKPVRA